jgi:DNA-binding transcriptional LysR family regulator
MSLVMTGRFVAIFPASALQFSAKQAEVVVLPIHLPMTAVPVGIVTLKNRTLSPVAKKFIEHTREVAKPLGNRKS